MSGMVVFTSLAEAIRQGYQLYERTPTGYIVRIRTERGFAFAVVEVTP